MFGRDMVMNPDMHRAALATDDDADTLSDRVAELEREAEEQLELHGITANGYMKRLHRQLAESLQMEASMLRRRRDMIRESPAARCRRPLPPNSEDRVQDEL